MMEQQIRKLATLKHGIEYLEDALREYNALYEMLVADGFEIDVGKLLAQKRADASLASGVRYFERVKKN